jgi:sirohydrochlorin ferrochelatase
MSLHFERALQDWREARAEYERVLHATYERAAEACRDRLVNEDGRRLGIEPLSLFMGTRARAYRYASEELVEWWRSHPRVPFVEFERKWLAERDAAHDAEIVERVLYDEREVPW